MINYSTRSRSKYAAGTITHWTWLMFHTLLCLAGGLAIVPQSALAQVCGTPGKDGIATPSGVVNTYYPGTGTASAGSPTVGIGTMQVGGITPIAAGDLVLIIQMQDGSATNFSNDTSYGGGMGSSVGSYEYARVASVSGSNLTLAKALTNTYSQVTPTAATAKKAFQVIRIPQYISASLSPGVTALPWDGSSGGIVAFDVYNTLDFSGGSIDVTGKGFRGGGSKDLAYYYPRDFNVSKGAVPFIYAGTYGGTTGTSPNTYPNNKLASFKGEGTSGTPSLMYNGTTLTNTGTEGYPSGDVGRGAPGNAGGGGIVGGDFLNGKYPGHDGGGGGGGNIGAGGIGGDTWEPPAGRWPNGGFGGSGITASFTKVLMGGGGGAGIDTDATLQTGRTTIADGIINGGPGGGIVFVRAGTIAGSGSILAKGVIGTNGNVTDAGGGGGAGGSVLVTARSGSFNSLTVDVRGGNGADSTYQQHGPGGGGGGGLVAYGGGATGVPLNIRTGGAAGFDAPRVTTIAKSNYGSAPGLSGGIDAGLPHTGCTRSNVLIVKRITAINGVSIDSTVDNPTTTSDNDPNWPNLPNGYLKGAIDIANVKPNDEIEYTIYYLNSGNVAAKKLRICDRLHKNLVFQTQFDLTSATVGKGINLTPGTNIPEYFTNADGDDKGYLSTTSTLPTNCNLTDSTNLTTDRIDPAKMSDNVVVVDIADSTNYLPGSISPGNPTNSFGYIRFKAKVKP